MNRLVVTLLVTLVCLNLFACAKVEVITHCFYEERAKLPPFTPLVSVAPVTDERDSREILDGNFEKHYINHIPKNGDKVALFFEKIVFEEYRGKFVLPDRFKNPEQDEPKDGYKFQPNGGLLSIELTSAEFAAAKHKILVFSSNKIALSLNEITRKTHYAVAVLDSSVPSFIKREGDSIEAEFHVLAQRTEKSPLEHRQLNFSCKLSPTTVEKLVQCLRQPQNLDGTTCEIFTGDKKSKIIQRKLCWSYPDKCISGPSLLEKIKVGSG